MKYLFIFALLLTGCDMRAGYIYAYTTGECKVYGNAQFERQVSGSTITCSITFEKTK